MKSIKIMAMAIIMTCGVLQAKITEEEKSKAFLAKVPVGLLEDRVVGNQDFVNTLIKDIQENMNDNGKKAEERRARLETQRQNTLKLVDEQIRFSKELNDTRIKPLMANTKSSIEFRKAVAALRDRIFVAIDKLNAMKKLLEVPIARARGGTVYRTPETLPAG